METLSRVEAVILSIDANIVELQLAGSYETVKWPRQLLNSSPQIGEKIVLELKNHPTTNVQKVPEKAKNDGRDHLQQVRLLESLIN